MQFKMSDGSTATMMSTPGQAHKVKVISVVLRPVVMVVAVVVAGEQLAQQTSCNLMSTPKTPTKLSEHLNP